jgi:mRNA-degrading endonuclease RelE of RelBE toxin-antitoxin system
MNVKIKVTDSFKRAAKRLIKKYPSLINELKELEEQLYLNPHLGEPLGLNCYKIRIRIKSKHKGKSGGARVITYLETEMILFADAIEKTIYLLTLYDKSETEDLSKEEIISIIQKNVTE